MQVDEGGNMQVDERGNQVITPELWLPFHAVDQLFLERQLQRQVMRFNLRAHHGMNFDVNLIAMTQQRWKRPYTVRRIRRLDYWTWVVIP